MKKKDPADSSKKNNGKKEKSLSRSYNEFKEFQGKKYAGMKIGHGHSWHYDQGDWKETKQTPDLWVFNYNVNKRRAGHALEGSGVPVGTECHWYIAAHQNVRKLDANTYSTAMRGHKYKIAHKGADKETWSTSYAGQRKRLIKFFQAILHQLELEEVEESKSKPKRAKKGKINEEVKESYL